MKHIGFGFQNLTKDIPVEEKSTKYKADEVPIFSLGFQPARPVNIISSRGECLYSSSRVESNR